MKVLLIDPPDTFSVYGRIGKRMPPFAPSLGLAYIAATLERNSISIKLLDARGNNSTIENILEEVKKYDPHIVGITCMTPSFAISVEIAKTIKSNYNDTCIIMGGPHVTPTAKDILEKQPFVDIAVIGEGENTMLDIAKGMNLAEISGIAYRSNGDVVINNKRPLTRNLDTIPFPARHLYNLNSYHQPIHESYGTPLTTVMTSRGCPYDCSFCSSKITFGRSIRYRSVGSVMEEIDHLIQKYRIKGIKFADDTFTLNEKRLEHLCCEIRKRKIYWIGNSRVETLNKDILALMKYSGCKLLQFGVESGDPTIQRELKKTDNLEQTQRVFAWAHELKLDTAATFIFGAPSETWETVNKTITFAIQIKPTYANFFILSPYPGTEIYEYMKAHGMMRIKDWTEVKSPKYQDFIINHPRFTHQELSEIQKYAYKKFYSNKQYIFSLLTKIDSWKKLRNYVNLALTALNFIKKNKISTYRRKSWT